LGNALRQLQLANRHRSIWTDAICINQKDEKEKAGQIQIMREIYKKATRVIVWLGTDPDNKADKAFDRITRIANDGNTLPGPYDSWWNPVAYFYNNAWFERLWVFQEITAASAADVLWGASKIPWKTVGRASTRIRTTLYHHILHCSIPNVYHAYLFYKWSDMNEHQNQPESFLFMLQITRKLQSSRNKDRIYALAGFRTADTNPADFQGPLDSRRRLQSIYQEFAKKVLTRMGTLDILSAVQHDANKPPILKSTWVPRWHIYSAETIAPLGSKYETYHSCRGLAAPQIQWRGKWKQFLHTDGIEFDSVMKTTEVITGLEDYSEAREVLASLTSYVCTGASSYPTGEPLTHVCGWTLTAGKDGYGMIVEDIQQHSADFAAFTGDAIPVMEQRAMRLLHGNRVLGENAARFHTAARFACNGRKLIFTYKGYIGIGPAASQTGDTVCVLAGGATPFLLRRDPHSQPSKRRFVLVGETYIHGIMRGEAVQQYGSENQTAVTFDII
jgi:hypothetical protein